MTDSLLNCLRDYKSRHIPMLKTLSAWLLNSRSYSVLDFEKLRTGIKTSDTIFVLGSGTSINDISEKQWRHIKEHDSVGINWWPLHDFIPTYYYSEYPKNREHFKMFKNILSERLTTRYNETIFFLSLNRAVQRGIHPMVIPDLFPKNPNICFYEHTKPMRIDNTININRASFNRTLFYRSSLTAVLNLVNKIGYKNIVLLGVDLNHFDYFYDNLPEMQKVFASGYGQTMHERNHKQHATTIGKFRKLPIQEYLYLLNDIYYKQNNIELYCGSSKSLLSEKIPTYW